MQRCRCQSRLDHHTASSLPLHAQLEAQRRLQISQISGIGSPTTGRWSTSQASSIELRSSASSSHVGGGGSRGGAPGHRVSGGALGASLGSARGAAPLNAPPPPPQQQHATARTERLFADAEKVRASGAAALPVARQPPTTAQLPNRPRHLLIISSASSASFITTFLHVPPSLTCRPSSRRGRLG